MFIFAEVQLQGLQSDLRASQRAAYAQGTTANLRTQCRSFLLFCIYFSLVPFPAHCNTICLYVQFLARSFKSVSAIKNYVAGVKFLHLILDLPFVALSNFQLKLVIRGLTRLKCYTPKQALPITPFILQKMHPHLHCSNPLHAALWCCFLLSFYLFARKSNMVPPSHKKFNKNKQLQRQDIKVCSAGLLVRIKWSKTLQAAERVLYIPVCAIPGSFMCPVAAYHNMCRLVRAPPSAPAFLVPHQKGLVSLTHASFTSHLKRLLGLAGVAPAAYSGHSFRRGGGVLGLQGGSVGGAHPAAWGLEVRCL